MSILFDQDDLRNSYDWRLFHYYTTNDLENYFGPLESIKNQIRMWIRFDEIEGR